MIGSLTIQGFGFTPDDAIADMNSRCDRHAEQGWRVTNDCDVRSGTNPYSDIAVYGYIATTTMKKAVNRA